MLSCTNSSVVKTVLYIFLLFMVTTSASTVDLKSEQKIIETTQEIKYLSQKIANDYLHFHHSPKKIELKRSLQVSIEKLENDFRFLAKSTDNIEIKNVLDFLSYTKDEIKNLISKDLDKNNIMSILDLSESLHEGSQSILENYKFLDRDINADLMRISKSYMAEHISGSNSIALQTQDEIGIVDKELKTNASWLMLKEILKLDKNSFLPNIVAILIKDIQKDIK